MTWMTLAIQWKLPLEDPILIFFLVLFVILFAPILFNSIRIPGIIGLILAGVAIGPNGFNLLLRDNSIILFGTVGLLYIMFQAGLEIDLSDFKKNKNKSILFGITTFTFPITIGTIASYYLLEFNLKSSILLASMFASHTLLAYPIVSRLGISKSESVVITVGGTLITDTSALLVLAIIAGSEKGDMNYEFWVRLLSSVFIFLIVVTVLFPRLGRWFLRKVQDNTSQYIFVLAMVFLGAFLAELAGLESIIGAFAAGLALNRLIPHSSPLMNRIEFVGNALFIPFFLISVGMLVNIKIIFQQKEAIETAIVMTTVALFSKWSSAFITQKLFNYNIYERRIIFGLSSAQAAATLAAVMVGFKLGLLNENVLNGTIVMILVTCLISSFITEKAAKSIALQNKAPSGKEDELPERILVPISNPATIDQLINLAILLKKPESKEPIYALSVVRDDEEANDKVLAANKMLEKAVQLASAVDTKVQIVTRVDLNIANGILRAAKDLIITDILIGWNAKITAQDKIFGSILDNVVKTCNQSIWVCNWDQPIQSVKKVLVIVPQYAEYEIGFERKILKITQLSRELGGKIFYYAQEGSIQSIRSILESNKITGEFQFEPLNNWENIKDFSKLVTKDDLVIVIHSRVGSISYQPIMDITPKVLSRYFQKTNFIIAYPPTNKPIEIIENYSTIDRNLIIPLQENIEKIKSLVGWTKFLKK